MRNKCKYLGGLGTISFVSVRLLSWIGHTNRMGRKLKIIQVFNNNPKGYHLRGRPENILWNSELTDINRFKIINCKESSKAELIRRSPLRRRRAAIACSVI